MRVPFFMAMPLTRRQPLWIISSLSNEPMQNYASAALICDSQGYLLADFGHFRRITCQTCRNFMQNSTAMSNIEDGWGCVPAASELDSPAAGEKGGACPDGTDFGLSA